MKKTLLIAALLSLAGCQSLQYAGNASYKVAPVSVDGHIVCCQVDVHDGKERASLDVHVVKTGDNYDITLSEKSVAAFEGQQIAAGAMKAAVDDAVKAAVAVELAPILPALAPALGAVITSGKTGAIVTGVAADKLINAATAPASVATPAK